MIVNRIVFILVGVFLMMLGFGTVSLFGQDLQVPSSNRAIIGKITSIRGEKLVVKEKRGDTIEIVTGGSTKVFGLDKKILRLVDIKVGDTVGAIATSSPSLTPKASTESGTALKQQVAAKLFVAEGSPSAKTQKQIVQGVITGINESLITVLEQQEPEKFATIIATTSALVKTKDNQPVSISSLVLGQRVAVVGVLDDTGAISSLLIHTISEK